MDDVSKAKIKDRCEGCWTFGPRVELIDIHVTNGLLTLCRQCLDDVNRKNPELVTLKSRLALVARPAPDADEPITEEWLREVSKSLRPGLGYVLNNDFCVMNSDAGWFLMIRMLDEDDNETDPMRLVNVRTRDQLSGLCKYLGIPAAPAS